MMGTAMASQPDLVFEQPKQVTPLMVNSFKLTAVVDKLAVQVRAGRQGDTRELYSLCLSLARGIDYAVANNDVPVKAQEWPILLKQLTKHSNDPYMQASIMVLMISVKNACKLGWFSEKDSQELITISNEMGYTFCFPRDNAIGQSHPNSSITTVMARFYPLMKMGQILACLEVNPGYGAYSIDFLIAHNTAHSPEEKIRLFVAQTDNIETSACVISPHEVSFLVNGKGVANRTNILMDFGPQMPTIVTSMLKYGTNLLQAVGQFNGHYTIVVAFMSMISSVDTSMLLNYVQSGTVEPYSDSEIIEGPSRISLCCPISRTRIRWPVKGQSCKHLQCFDFSNYVEMNSGRPSWRCPHCNQFVCYSDIRIDQYTAKVLKEVGEDVVAVIISPDRSWKTLTGNDSHVDLPQHKKLSVEEHASFSNVDPDVLDLSGDDNEMDLIAPDNTEDRKPCLTNLQSQPSDTSTTVSLNFNFNSSVEINQNIAAPLDNNLWSGLNHGSNSSAWLNEQIVDTNMDIRPYIMTSPIVSHTISPAALNREAEVRGNVTSLQSQFSTPTTMQFQETGFANQLISQDHRNMSTIPRNITFVPVATVEPRSMSNLTTSIPNGSAHASQTSLPTADRINRVSMNMERQHQFPRSFINQPHVSGMVSPLRQHNVAAQGVGFSSSSQIPSVYGVSSFCSPEQNSDLPRLPQSMSQPVGMYNSSSPTSWAHTPQVLGQATDSGNGNNQPDMFGNAAQQALQSLMMAGHTQASRNAPSYPTNIDDIRASMEKQRGNVGGGMVQTVSKPEDLIDLSSQLNWRPTGRMRGSLLSGTYSTALDPLIIRPTQSVHTTRPPITSPSVTPRPPTWPSQVGIRPPTHPTQVAPRPPTQVCIRMPTQPTQVGIRPPTQPIQVHIRLSAQPTQVGIRPPTQPTQVGIRPPTQPTQVGIRPPAQSTQVGIQTPTQPTSVGIQTPTQPTSVGIRPPTQPIQVGIRLPTQPTQVSPRPPTLPTQAAMARTNIPSPILRQRYHASSMHGHVAQTQSYSTVEPVIMNEVSDMLREESPSTR